MTNITQIQASAGLPDIDLNTLSQRVYDGMRQLPTECFEVKEALIEFKIVDSGKPMCPFPEGMVDDLELKSPFGATIGKTKYIDNVCQGLLYRTDVDCFRSNFAGFARLTYTLVPVDTDGYPLIEDNYTEAIRYYVAKRYCESMLMTDPRTYSPLLEHFSREYGAASQQLRGRLGTPNRSTAKFFTRNQHNPHR